MSVQEIRDAINDVCPIIVGWKKGNVPDLDEKETRRLIIDPILTALGWSTVKSFHTIPEYFVNEETGHRIDYAMFTDDGDPTVIIEAKRLREHTLDLKNYLQLAKYAGLGNARNLTAVLTNGEFWTIIEVDNHGNPVEMDPIGLLWPRATTTRQAQRLYVALARERHRKRRNRGGGVRHWR